MFKQLKNYISSLDQFLKSFDRSHSEKSASQEAEIKKHESIAQLRDGDSDVKKKFWEKF